MPLQWTIVSGGADAFNVRIRRFINGNCHAETVSVPALLKDSEELLRFNIFKSDGTRLSFNNPALTALLDSAFRSSESHADFKAYIESRIPIVVEYDNASGDHFSRKHEIQYNGIRRAASVIYGGVERTDQADPVPTPPAAPRDAPSVRPSVAFDVYEEVCSEFAKLIAAGEALCRQMALATSLIGLPILHFKEWRDRVQSYLMAVAPHEQQAFQDCGTAISPVEMCNRQVNNLRAILERHRATPRH